MISLLKSWARPTKSPAGVLIRLAGISAATLLLALAVPPSGTGSALAQTPACASSGSARPPSAQSAIDADPRYVRILFMDSCGQSVPLAVDLAATSERQERGLMAISVLPADQGEIFIFTNLGGGEEVQVGFWMQDTLIPLSIAFIGRDGVVHEIQDMQAQTTDLHIPRQPYLYAVEANLGWFARHSIVPGSRVDLSAALALLQPAAAP